MLEELISQGQAFTEEVSGLVGTQSLSIEIEKWASQSVMYLNKEIKVDAVTDRVNSAYKTLNVNAHMKHSQILGALLAAKEIKDKHNDFAKKYGT